MTNLEQVRQSISGKELPGCRHRQISFPIITFFKYPRKKRRMNVHSLFINGRRKTAGVNPLKFSHAEFLLGMYHFAVEEFEAALNLLVRARKQFDDLNDPDGKANC